MTTAASQTLAIARNTGALTLSSAVEKLLGFLFILYFARHYSVADLGKFAVVIAMVTAFHALSSMGLPELLVREISKERAKVDLYLFNSLGVLLLSGVIGASVMAAVVWALSYPADTSRMLYIATLYLIPASFTAVIWSVFRAYERMELQAAASMGAAAFRVIASVILLAMGRDIVVLAVIIVLARVLASLISLILLARLRLSLHFRFDPSFCLDMVRASRHFYLIGVVVILFASAGPLLLSKLASERDVGLYNAADRLVQMLLLVGLAYGTSLYPAFSRGYQASASAFQRLARKALQYAWVLPLPIVVGTTVLADQIIVLIYGQHFVASAIALQILIWALIPQFLNPVLSSILFATNNEGISARVASFRLIFFVITSLLLIPGFGYVGAALATVLSFSFAAAQNYLFVHRNLLRIDLWDLASKPTAAVGGVALFLLAFKGMDVILLIPVSAILYGTSLLLTGVISREDIASLSKFKPKEG